MTDKTEVVIPPPKTYIVTRSPFTTTYVSLQAATRAARWKTNDDGEKAFVYEIIPVGRTHKPEATFVPVVETEGTDWQPEGGANDQG